MKNGRLSDFELSLISIVGVKQLLLEDKKMIFFAKGIRVGGGSATAVVFPKDLLEFWKVLEACVTFGKIIIVQAANTGLTGGSTPDGDNYDRDVVIINTLKISKSILLNGGSQVIAFPGTTLNKLEKILLPKGRGPHSVIGSSCIGASVIGGVCNNSGGNLVNRGPAYTELSLYAQVTNEGKLDLVNHLGIDLGKSPEEILYNLENKSFDLDNVKLSSELASDSQYKNRVRDIRASSPARYNSDKRRLYESSGCAGKLAVFAVRLDTFPLPKREQVFFIGTNDPSRLTSLRKKILTEFKTLPDMGEYMHSSYFDGADKYCKDTFLIIKYFGTEYLTRILSIKRRMDLFFSSLFFLPDNFLDKIFYFLAKLLPDHLPRRLREYRLKFEHYMLILASDSSIEETENLLNYESSQSSMIEYIKCDKYEGKDALLHRYVSGAAPSKFSIINSDEAGEMLPLDVALPRNCEDWDKMIPDEILSQTASSFKMGHFLCMVFHWDFVVKKGLDANILKEQLLAILDSYGAKYPAEHNVGHLYKADKTLADFYRTLDPTNSLNPGIGKDSKNKFYK